MILRLAWRNVLRNRRRSAITVLSIAIGLAAMTFMWAFIDGMNAQMIENTTRYFSGDVQVHLKGYHDDPSLDLTMADADAVLAAVLKQPNVAAAAVRLEAKALASRGEKSQGVVVAGVAPREESRLTVLFDAIVDGRPLAASEPGVLLGEELAQTLDARAGDELVLVGQAYDGSLASGRYPVRGVFRTRINELDRYLAVMPIDVMRELYAAPQGATAVALRLDDREQVEAVRTSLANQLRNTYEVLAWPQLLPMVAVSVRFHEVVTYVILLVFFVVVAAAVANPVLMAVLERTRELGIMLALGMSPASVLRLVLCESLLLGLAGVLAGNVIGLAVTGWFARTGIDLGAFEAGLRTMSGLSDMIYPVVRADRSVALTVVVLAIVAATALYPAAKAALLQPVAAIRGFAGSVTSAGRGAAARIRLPLFVAIAARNLVRNKRRTAIMIFGAGFGMLSFVFLLAFFDGFFEQMIDNSTRYLTGHAQIERPGFRRDYAPELTLEDAETLLRQARGAAGVAAASPRVQSQALASTAAKSEGIMLIGVDPVAERDVTFIHRTVVEGKPLAAGTDRDVLIGRKLAEKLRARLGEKLVIMAQAANGELATGAYRVGGIFATESSAFDGAFAFVTLPAAQSLLALGSRVSTINVRVPDRSRLPATLEALRAAAGSYEVVPWQTLLPQVDEMIRLNQVISRIILAVLLVVIATAIMNTVFMAVAERTREFGVMMALGTSPAAIRRTVVYETLALLGLALLAGYAAGALLVLYFGRAGIDLSGFFAGYSAIPGLTGLVYPKLVSATIVPPGVALVVAGVLASLYPAARAARLDPSIAIRHV